MKKHWANQYIGDSWTTNNTCWTFFRRIQDVHYGRKMPMIGFEVEKAIELANGFKQLDILGLGWEPCSFLEDGHAMVFMRSSSLPHVGTWIQEGTLRGVLHCERGIGVQFSEYNALFRAQWSDITYFKWIK